MSSEDLQKELDRQAKEQREYQDRLDRDRRDNDERAKAAEEQRKATERANQTAAWLTK